MAQDASTPLYIVPRGHNTRLCAVQEGQFIDLAPLPFAAQSVFVRGDEGWWACMVKKGRRRGGKIARFQVLHEREIRASPAIVLPQGYSALAIAIKGQTLYVGGGGRTADMLGLYDLQASQPRWHTLEVPPSLRQQGKQIDALLLHDDRLLAVDNLVLPKWLLTYDVTVPETPCLLDVYKLPAHGTYEQVHQGAIGMHWWALLSGTVGMTGEAQHLALYSTQQRQEYGSVSHPLTTFHPTRWAAGPEAAPPEPWHSLAFVSDYLLIAAGTNGIGILDLSAVPAAVHQRPMRHGPVFLRVSYVKPPAFAHEAVLRLIPVSTTDELIVISYQADAYATRLLQPREYLGHG